MMAAVVEVLTMTYGTQWQTRADGSRYGVGLLPIASATGTEAELQRSIELRLMSGRFRYKREQRIGTRDRVDFLIGSPGEPRLALEVKIQGSAADVLRQLHRYAESRMVGELLLVTTQAAHLHMPTEMLGKRVQVLHLPRVFA